MTKKDYVKLAEVLRLARKSAKVNEKDHANAASVRMGISMVEMELRRMLASDNSKFDDDKFREASGAFDASLR